MKHAAKFALPLFALLACVASGPRWMTPQELVARLQSAEPAQQVAAAQEAWKAGPEAIPALAPLLASEQPATRKNAELALESIAHRASAPDSGGDRQRASAELLRLLDAPLANDQRGALLRLLGTTADDAATVHALAARLSDKELADSALFALQRIPGTDAERALIDALSQSGLAVTPADLARSLGARRSRGAVPALIALSDKGGAQQKRAAREALSRIGDPRAAELLRGAAKAGEPGATLDLLRFADARTAAGAAKEALPLYESLLGAPLPHERIAALRGIARTCGDGEGARAAFAPALAALSDADAQVRAAARDELAGSRWPGAGAELSRSMEQASDAALRAELLRVLVARRDPRASELLQGAILSEQVALRTAAAELASESLDPALEPAVRRCAKSADAGERAAGLAGVLAYAKAHQRAGEKERALELFHELLDAPEETSIAVAALAGVAAAAQPASLERLRPLAQRSELIEAVDKARVAIATTLAKSERSAAVAELQSVCAGRASRSVRTAAAKQLEELGVDTGALARRRGFLTAWYLCGTFPAATDADFGTQPFGAAGPAWPQGEPSEAAAGAGLPAWKAFASKDLDGAADLTELFEPHDNVCAYALAKIESPAEADAVLKLGSDDGIAAWLNGELVHSNNDFRGLSADEDTLEVHLRAGTNTLLLKITQGGGGWGFCARLCDARGEPVDLTSR